MEELLVFSSFESSGEGTQDVIDVLGEMLQDVGVIHFEELGLSQQ